MTGIARTSSANSHELLSRTMTTSLAIAWLLLFATTASAGCECGYSVNGTESEYAIFTDAIETDFLHVKDSSQHGWIPQDYNTSADQANGPYGMAKQNRNLMSNYIDNEWKFSGPGIDGAEPGLQLWVHPEGGDGDVPCAEIVSERDDILYGSFRIAMKTTNVNGTCSAFFVYRNDSQEIDLELLSAEQRMNDWPVHLVVQNTSATEGEPGSRQLIYQMPSSPADDYNEYRFDWLPDRIDYYINGKFAWSETQNVPSAAGRIHISHWSNGNPFWTRGPPVTDAVTTVSYVKAYFNSTNASRVHEYQKGCAATTGDGEKAMCRIPNQEQPPNPFGKNGNETGHTVFLTQQESAGCSVSSRWTGLLVLVISVQLVREFV
jgi:hypothetical protein